MQKFITDVHTHSSFSFDSETPLEKMLEKAYQKGVAFYGISDHFNYEILSFYPERKDVEIDEKEYFHKTRHLQEDYAGCMNVLVGAEFGFGKGERVAARYQKIVDEYAPDFIVNSIHCCNGEDYFERGRRNSFPSKEELYREYLSLIRESLDVPYPYDIVGHIAYVTRYTHYEDRRLTLAEFGAEIDDILKTIIQKDKILEVNSSNRGGVSPFLPSNEIIERYYELGGRKISYASDAHDCSRICDKREEVIALLKQIGFTYLTVPCRGEHIKVEI